MKWIKTRWAEHKATKVKVQTAKEAFQRDYPDRKLIPQMSGVFYDTGESMIVQVCYDHGAIPPARTWWLVKGDSCNELNYEEANAIHSIPKWR